MRGPGFLDTVRFAAAGAPRTVSGGGTSQDAAPNPATVINDPRRWYGGVVGAGATLM